LNSIFSELQSGAIAMIVSSYVDVKN